MTHLPEADLDRIEAEANAATPGPCSMTDKSKIWAIRTNASAPSEELRKFHD